MTALETLADLGFIGSEIVAEKRGLITVRVRTAAGWTYEKFPNDAGVEAAICAWALGHEPEPA